MLPRHMKTIAIALACSFLSASGQEKTETTPKAGNTKWDVGIPGPISDGTVPAPAAAPEAIDFKVISSRTTRMDVTRTAEMPDLPEVTGTINVTVQLVEDPKLPKPPPPVMPTFDPFDSTEVAETTRIDHSADPFIITATAYDRTRTFLHIQPYGKSGQDVTAWSNLDPNHFGGFTAYQVKDSADGTIHDFNFEISFGENGTRPWEAFGSARGIESKERETAAIPEMRGCAEGGPAFVVVKGDGESAAMDALEHIHDLYRKEGARMEAAYKAREKAREEREAYLLANPPESEDITIRFWKRNTPSHSRSQTPEGGAQP